MTLHDMTIKFSSWNQETFLSLKVGDIIQAKYLDYEPEMVVVVNVQSDRIGFGTNQSPSNWVAGHNNIISNTMTRYSSWYLYISFANKAIYQYKYISGSLIKPILPPIDRSEILI